MDPKAEQMGGDKDSKDGGEKKPPVTKIIDLEVVGVRKRYLVERYFILYCLQLILRKFRYFIKLLLVFYLILVFS